MSDETPTLPGLESAIAEMEKTAITDKEVDELPTFTGERVAIYEPKRYALAARLLFAENISRRTICKWLHMSPNTLSAIEAREIKLHPESIEALKLEAQAELEQLKRLGREALRARFFDKKGLEDTSLKELASTLKILDEMSKENAVPESNRNAENSGGNEYFEIIESNGFGEKEFPAPESQGNERPALRAGQDRQGNERKEPGEAQESAIGSEGNEVQNAGEDNTTELHLK